MNNQKPEILPKKNRWQFSIGQLLVLTLVAGVIFSFVRFFIGWRAMFVAMLLYSVPLSIWAVIRGPSLARDFKRLRQKRQVARMAMEEALRIQRLKPRKQDAIKANES